MKDKQDKEDKTILYRQSLHEQSWDIGGEMEDVTATVRIREKSLVSVILKIVKNIEKLSQKKTDKRK